MKLDAQGAGGGALSLSRWLGSRDAEGEEDSLEVRGNVRISVVGSPEVTDGPAVELGRAVESVSHFILAAFRAH